MAEKLPPGAEKIRQLKIDTGIVNITRIDGYRILYNNDKDAPFVNMKVEQSESKEYINDQQKLIANLAYINTHSANSESDKLIELNYGGYKVYGSNRNSISTGTTILGTFILFPGDNTTVYLYFNNLKPDVRHYENVEEYKKLRDHFIEGYIKNLQSCEK